ncbi:MAG: SRPBCC family protein [Actinomycetota bacterium]|nr:SRPBCC family protein [Actinomycetota bacterium]
MATNQLDIRASPEEVFGVPADAWSYADWVVGTQEIPGVDAGFPAVGTRFRHRVRAGPATVDGETEVIGADGMCWLSPRASASDLGHADIRFELAPTVTGTEVTMHETPFGSDGARLGWLTERMLRLRNAETLWRLKRLVEARTSEPRVEPFVGARRYLAHSRP